MNKKIGYKLIAIVGLVSIIIIGMFSYKISSANRNALIAQIDHHANQLSETVKSSTKYDMLLN